MDEVKKYLKIFFALPDRLPARLAAYRFSRHWPREEGFLNSYQLFLWLFQWLVAQGGGSPEMLPAIPMGIPLASGPGSRGSIKAISYSYGYSYG